MNRLTPLYLATLVALPVSVSADMHSHGDKAVSDDVIAEQRANLAKNTKGKGFGPQSPRDIESMVGTNEREFEDAPHYSEMNLCNIHFHENAEHRGGQFTDYAGNGNGKGYNTGFEYSGELTEAELAPLDAPVCNDEYGGVVPGDTIELHYVHTTAQVEPGPTLGACLSEAIANPQLRVEAQVYVAVNDKDAADFRKLAKHGKKNGLHQALHIPTDTGVPVQYEGSTTGPGFNEQGSPLQVSWSVRPNVKKVDIRTVGKWCEDNVFDESHGHGVRNLVTNPALLSDIEF